MRCIFSGVGEAFDEREPNTSVVVEADGSAILLDCGFTAGHGFFALDVDPSALEAVCLSHFHGDHWLGLPALLVRLAEEGRARDLAVVGQAGVEGKVLGLVEMAYPGLLGRMGYGLTFMESGSGARIEAGGFNLAFAPTAHSVPNLAVRVERGGKAFFFSGDGSPTRESTDLARGCGLAVHEAYGLASLSPGHGTVDACLECARKAGVGLLALVHVQRDLRRERKAEILARLEEAEDVEAALPESGQAFEL